MTSLLLKVFAAFRDDLKSKAEPNIVICLVGNKIDLVEHKLQLREVPSDHAKRTAVDEGLLYADTSAIKGVKVNEAFEMLIEEIYAKNKNAKRVPAEDEVVKSLVFIQPKSKLCC